MDLSQDSDLTPFLGDLGPNKNLSEIELPLAKTPVSSYFYCNKIIILF